MGNYYSSNVSDANSNNYGWKKDNVDKRDLYHNFQITNTSTNIKHIDLRDKCPPVYDQGQLGSCTANAIAGLYEYDEMKEEEQNIFTPSRLFIYYNEREIEGTINEDSGAQIRDGIKSINSTGVCPESMWPYDISKFKDEPTQKCYMDAAKHHAVEYKRVPQTLEQIRQCLIEGFPFAFGFIVYASFESQQVAETGEVPMPQEGEQVVGGHAVACVGFDDTKNVIICRNSWGDSWGDKGYFYMPYDYILNSEYCNDLWTVRRVVDN